MIRRYTLPEMGALWTDEHRFATWLEVELAVTEALEERGEVPAGTARAIRAKASIRPERIEELEQTLQHDVLAFLTSIAETAGEPARFLHLGMTSSDLLDTALALVLRRSGLLLEKRRLALEEAVLAQAERWRRTPIIGRSHGVHAEPTTFGLKLLVWVEELRRHGARLAEAVAGISVGKVSGAVGNFAHLDPEVEERAMARLGLLPAPVTSQVVQRDRHAHFVAVLAGLSSSLEKFATEIRNLHRTEIGEAEEAFAPGQKGSSAMPHKRNPILCERVAGLARVVRGYATAAEENVALWHERDITHSSVERIILPDATTLVDYQLHLFTGVVAHLVVHPDRMLENLRRTGGQVFSQRLLLALTRTRLAREDAYRIVQSLALEAPAGGATFEERARADREIRAVLSEAEIEECFALEASLRNVDAIYERVLGRRR